ncbi:MAG: hypothetical protein N4A45_03790 [Flavobacteriales bacterium]|jgi:hypothetical protein|nr:hypothetical protein [Flavobacteriales bacterium]
MAFNKYQHVDPLEIRPRFRVLAQADDQDLMKQVWKKAQEEPSVYPVKTYGTHLDIYMKKEEQSFFSPVLHLNFDQTMGDSEDDTMVRCLIGPKQSNWVIFVFIYGFLSVVGTFAGIYGLVQYYQFDNHTPWLWTFPISAIIIATIYTMVKMGQRAKQDQTIHLVRFLYYSLEGFEYERRME